MSSETKQPSLRNVGKGYTHLFSHQRDHVMSLLGPTQNHASGVFREALIKDYLRAVLPSSFSVDTGFIYAFDQLGLSNSRQIDILVWDSQHYPAVYRTRDFVIVCPESVLCAVSVKTTLDHRGVVNSLENLLSFLELDQVFRGLWLEDADRSGPYRPILKAIAAYEKGTGADTVLRTVQEFYCSLLSDRSSKPRIDLVSNRESSTGEDHIRYVQFCAGLLPQIIFTLDDDPQCFMSGWGPTKHYPLNAWDDEKGVLSPCIYSTGSSTILPLEKLTCLLLGYASAALGSDFHSVAAAWGDFDSLFVARLGDPYEFRMDSFCVIGESC